MYVVCVTVLIKPGKGEAFLEEARKNHEGSVQEPGCLRFDVAVDSENPNRFLLFEEFIDEAAVDAHLATPHFQPIRDGLDTWLAQPGVNTFARRVEPTQGSAALTQRAGAPWIVDNRKPPGDARQEGNQ